MPYNISPKKESATAYRGQPGGQSVPAISPKELDIAITHVKSYAKSYADSLVARIKSFKQKVVQSLPEEGDPTTLYFVPSSNPQTSNIHDEYIWVVPDADAGETFQPHWEQVGSTAIDHEIVNDDEIGKLVLTIGTDQYAIAREKIEPPAAPTIPANTTFDGSKTINVTDIPSGATIRYTTNGVDPTAKSGSTGSSITLAQDSAGESKSKTYTVKVVSVKNGRTSPVVTRTYTINRKLAAPTISNPGGTKYDASRSVTITNNAVDEVRGTLQYKIGEGEWITPALVNNQITIHATGNITAKVTNGDTWVDNSASKTVEVNAKKCYIGGAGASISSLNGLNGIEADELSGSESVTISSDGYIWFVVPDTATISSITSGPLDVPFSLIANSVSGYNCYRTDNEIAAGTHTFNIS